MAHLHAAHFLNSLVMGAASAKAPYFGMACLRGGLPAMAIGVVSGMLARESAWGRLGRRRVAFDQRDGSATYS
jgi:hypothetical protein